MNKKRNQCVYVLRSIKMIMKEGCIDERRTFETYN